MHYKFLEELSAAINLFKEILSWNYVDLYEKISGFKDNLLDLKEELIDKIKGFMKSDKKNIYDEVINFLNSESGNLGYLSADNSEKETLLKVKAQGFFGYLVCLGCVQRWVREQPETGAECWREKALMHHHLFPHCHTSSTH